MKYDKHTQLIETIVLYLDELNPTDHLTLDELLKYFPKLTRVELKKTIEDYDYNFLFNTDCECNRKGGGSTEDMYLLSVSAERLILESNSFKARILQAYNKPMKLYCKGEYFKNIGSPIKTVILIVWTMITTFISIWLGIKQVSNEEINNVDSKTLMEKNETISRQELIIDSLKIAYSKPK